MLDKFLTVLMFLCCALAAIMGTMMFAEGDVWLSLSAVSFSMMFFGFGLYFGAESEK